MIRAMATAQLHNIAQESRLYCKKNGSFSTESMPPWSASDVGLQLSLDAAFRALGISSTAATFCNVSNLTQESRNREYENTFAET